MTLHDCLRYQPGCHRCEIGRDEYIADLEEEVLRLRQAEQETERLQAAVDRQRRVIDDLLTFTRTSAENALRYVNLHAAGGPKP